MPPGAGGGRAGPGGRRRRQRPRRARDRRQGGARPRPRVRVAGGRARERGQGEAGGLPRGPARSTAEEALLSKRLVTLRTRRAGHARPRGAAPPGAGPRAAAHALFTELEFEALAKRVRARGRGHRHERRVVDGDGRRWTRSWPRRGAAGRVAVARGRHRRRSPCGPGSWGSASRTSREGRLRPARPLAGSSGRRRPPCRTFSAACVRSSRTRRSQGERERQARPRRARAARASGLAGLGFDAARGLLPPEPGAARLHARRPRVRVPGGAARLPRRRALAGADAVRGRDRAHRGRETPTSCCALDEAVSRRACEEERLARRSTGRWSCRSSTVLADMERAGVKVNSGPPRLA